MRINKKKVLYLLLISCIGVIVSCWTLNDDFYFLFDDIAWLKVVKYYFDPKNFFTVLPTSRYNDRPLRTFFFWLMYQCFGLNYTAYYAVCIVLHIFNAYLFFEMVSIILDRLGYEDHMERAAVCALFFVAYSKNLMAVYWLSGAANDMLCTMFILLSGILYLKYMNTRKVSFAIVAMVMYILSMRSKEAAILFPISVVGYEVYEAYVKKEKQKVHCGWLFLVGYMLAYLGKYLSIPVNSLTMEGQYKQDVSLVTIIRVLMNYIRMYFGLDDGTFSYTLEVYYTKIGNIGIVIVSAILVVSIYILGKKLKEKKDIIKPLGILILMVFIGMALAPLLILPNIQHMLYFYYVAIYLSFLFGAVIYEIASCVLENNAARKVMALGMVLLVVFVSNFTTGARVMRESWLRYGREAKSAAEDILNIADVPCGYTCYIEGAEVGANIFNYGPGDCIAVLSNHDGVQGVLLNENVQKIAPYVVWKYDTGHVYEVERVK